MLRQSNSSVTKLTSLRDFIQEIYQIWVSEKPNQLAAALSYFGMFSFAAVIYIAFWLASFFINEAAAAELFYTRIESVLGSETAAFIQDSVSKIAASTSGGSLIVSIVSLISLLFAAMGLFLQLKYVLNRIWGVPLIQRGAKVSAYSSKVICIYYGHCLRAVGYHDHGDQRDLCLVWLSYRRLH